MGATLDRSRPFGTVSGDHLGRAFEQDSLHFNADGSLWVEPAPPNLPSEAPPPDEPEPARPAARKGKR
jgi:hypothetical protein